VATHKNQSWHATGANKKKEKEKAVSLAASVCCINTHQQKANYLPALSSLLKLHLFISRLLRHLSEKLYQQVTRFFALLAKMKHVLEL